jgi:polyhydroxybutyrate depolymerase
MTSVQPVDMNEIPPRPHAPRTAAALTIAVVLATLAAACGVGHSGVASTPVTADSSGHVSLPTGSSTQGITVNGQTRSYRVYRPTGLSGAVPMVVMLHGGFGSASQAESTYGWDAQADKDHFVVVYPDGENHAWNGGGGCCGQPGAKNVDDVAFITAVVHAVEKEIPIDTRRVYATGISNGGIMSYRMACDTTLFAAIGPDSATLLGSCDHPAPVSVIHIHGTADTRIRYDGGKGKGRAEIDGPPVPTVVADWRTVDGCAAPTGSTSGVLTTSIASCPDGRSVELITIAGAGHQWPGSKDRKLLRMIMDLDAPSTALNATSTIWAFFAAHPS